jgi:nitroimidazol reductase NimA-like FMN-containing flavoprotein (pyridoxamine 5'-phosphate oxidase superfamily)
MNGPPEATLEQLSHDECLALLRGTDFGRIGLLVDDAPIVLPVNFRLAETSSRSWIALRTRPGNVIDRAALHVAFEIDGVDPARQEGWSVLVRGTLHHVDPDAADFRERFDPQPWLLAERDSWLVIDPYSVTGRRLRAAPFEWAFQPSAYL